MTDEDYIKAAVGLADGCSIRKIELFSVYDRFCFKHEGNFLKDYCPSCFRDKLLATDHDGQEST